ncbi:MAG: CvpA family protein [Myxococcales bacterium]|nr:CvpA family protein [Myxococcales bacterium]
MALDLLAFLILAVFAAVGALRGALTSGLSFAGLLVAYATAALGATLLGVRAADRFELPLLVAAPVAGAIVGTLAFVLFGAWGSALRRKERERLGEEPRAASDRVVGAGFGAARGLIVVLLLSYLGSWVDAAQRIRPASNDEPVAAPANFTEGSLAANLAGGVVEQVVHAAAGDGSASRVLARVAGRPGASMESVRALAANPSLRELQGDAFFWTLVSNGAAHRASNQLSFQRLLADPELRMEFANLGLVSAEAADDPSALRSELLPVLEELAPRLQRIKEDPEVFRLAEDPEIVAHLQSGNTLALIAHPRIRAIAARISEAP